MSAHQTYSKNRVHSYLVKVVAGSVSAIRVWNPKKPMKIGHDRSWILSLEDGGVRILPEGTGEGSAEHFIKNNDLENGATVELFSGDKKKDESFRLEVRPTAVVSAAFLEKTTVGNALRVFQAKGGWTVDSNELIGRYTARNENKKIFKLRGNAVGFYTLSSVVEVEALVNGVSLETPSAKSSITLALKKGETRRIRFGEASGSVLRYAGTEWRLAAFTKETDPALFTAPKVSNSENTLFRKTLMGALCASLLLGFIAWIAPGTPPVAKQEKIHIFLAKKKTVQGLMTAAPKGDPKSRDFSVGRHGLAKNAGMKGASVAQVKKVSPTGKTQKLVRHVQKTAMRPMKRVAQARPKASSRKVLTSKKSVKVAQASPHRAAVKSIHAKSTVPRNRVAAVRPAPIPHSELFKTFSSASFRKTAQGLTAGGFNGGGRAEDVAAEARRLGSANGSGRGDLGGVGGVETRSASVTGFGGGGAAAGDGGPGSRGAGYGRGSYSKVSGEGRSFVSLDTGASDVDRGLTWDQVNRVIAAHWNEVRYCYESSKLRTDNIQGSISVNFAVGPPGVVTSAGIDSSTVGDQRLHQCLLGRLKGWKFPKPQGGKTVAVAYPFKFKTLTR